MFFNFVIFIITGFLIHESLLKNIDLVENLEKFIPAISAFGFINSSHNSLILNELL